MPEEFDKTLELEHELVIKEEIQEGRLKSKKDLPAKIKNKITGIVFKIGKYKKNPTEEMKEDIEQQSIKIADDITVYLDTKKQEPDEPDNVVQPAPPKEPVKKEPEPKPDPEPTPVDDEKKKTAEIEREILKVIERDGHIHSTDLRDIAGFESVEDIPDLFKIGNTTLESDLVGNYYKK